MTLEAKLSKVIEESTEQTKASQALVDTAIKSMDKIDEFSAKTEQVFNLSKANSDALTKWHTTTEDTVQFKQHDGKTYAVESLHTFVNKAGAVRSHEATMSKAQFDALREIRKKQFAGSGFVEWGRCYTNEGNWSPEWINEGLFQPAVHPAHKDRLIAGSDGGAPNGSSLSNIPQLVVDGTLINLSMVASDNPDLNNNIIFPPAPDGTKTYDSATGILTQHSTVNEAFEGVISNGDFRLGNDGTWQQLGDIRISETGADFASTQPNKELWQDIEVAHTDYTVSFMANQAGSLQLYLYGDGEQDGYIDVNVKEGFNQFTIKASERNKNFNNDHAFLIRDSSGTKFNGIISQISVIPISQSVVTSRKDLVFLESWHENIADKDIVYPFGNVQFGANKYQEIKLTNTLVAQGYSAFGEWDTKTFGFGAKWSALSDTEKAVFLSKPEHNIYYDPETKAYIQVRYRVRVIEGYGDNWEHLNNQSGAGSAMRYLGYGRGLNGNVDFIAPRGSADTVVDWIVDYPVYANSSSAWLASDAPNWTESTTGQFSAVLRGGSANSDIAHDGKCHALPIALVQRMNQGAYHPSYNPMGVSLAKNSSGAGSRWWQTDITLNSSFNCFTNKIHGNLASSSSGSYGAYQFYDAIYAGQVEDLRLNAKKQSKTDLLNRFSIRALEGKIRGIEKPKMTIFSQIEPVTMTSVASYNIPNVGGTIEFNVSAGTTQRDSYLKSDKNIGYYIYNQAGKALYIPIKKTTTLREVHWPYSGNSGTRCYLYGVENKLAEFNQLFKVNDLLNIAVLRELDTSFETLPHVDIVGSPDELLKIFPDNNGIYGQWIPTIPDGTSKEFIFNRKVDTDFTYWGSTSDQGKSWNFMNYTPSEFNAERNSRTMPPTSSTVYFFNYLTKAKMTESDVNTILAGEIGKVITTLGHGLANGSGLQYSLTDTIPKKPNGNTNAINTLSLTSSDLGIDNRFKIKQLTHSPVQFEKPNYDSRDIKTLVSLVEKQGLYYAQFNGAELKHNGTDWGDDQTIPIIDGENTKTDLNGNSVKAFCHHTQLPIGIAHHN